MYGFSTQAHFLTPPPAFSQGVIRANTTLDRETERARERKRETGEGGRDTQRGREGKKRERTATSLVPATAQLLLDLQHAHCSS